MEAFNKSLVEAEKTLQEIWERVGLSCEEKNAATAELMQRIERLVSETVRQAESVERRWMLEARGCVECISSLAKQLDLDPSSDASSHEIVGPLLELWRTRQHGDGKPNEQTGWPFSRPLDNDARVAMQGRPLRDIVEALRIEQARVESVADIRIHNLFILGTYEGVLELPFAQHEAAWKQLMDASASYEPVEMLASPPAAARKRPRESDATVLAALQDADGSAVGKRLLRRQDLSMRKLGERIGAVSKRVEQLNEEVQLRVAAEEKRIAELSSCLTAAQNGVTHPNTTALEGYQRIVRDEACSPPMVVCCERPSEVFPEVWELLQAPPQSSNLQRVVAARIALEQELWRVSNERLEECVVLLADTYETFYRMTGDASYAQAPNYHEWVQHQPTESSCIQAAEGSTHPRDTLRRRTTTTALGRMTSRVEEDVARVNSAIKRASEEQASLSKRVSFVREHVLPLWNKRSGIILRKDQLQHASRDRLFSKRGNMARVLLEEETLRKEVNKMLPQLASRLNDLAQEWTTTFGGELYMDGKKLRELLAAELEASSFVHASSLTPLKYSPRTRGDQENLVSSAAKPSSHPSSRRNSPAPLSNRTTAANSRAGTPCRPPTHSAAAQRSHSKR